MCYFNKKIKTLEIAGLLFRVRSIMMGWLAAHFGQAIRGFFFFIYSLQQAGIGILCLVCVSILVGLSFENSALDCVFFWYLTVKLCTLQMREKCI